MFLYRRIILTVSFIFAAAFGIAAQDQPARAETNRRPTPTPTPAVIDPNKPVTAETVAESAIAIYGGLGGRKVLDQIRKTAIERGRMRIANSQGQMENSTYQKWIIRGENLAKERIRIEQEFPNTRYALVRADEKTFGLLGDAEFSPRADVARTFENGIFRGLEALLRYKENGSTVELAGRDKIMGVDYHFLDVIDKQGRKTRFYISARTLRVMMIDYEDEGVKYRRKFYDYNYAQSTLVPFRTTLSANDKLVEESEILTVTYGQKVDEGLFKSSS